MIDKPRPLFSLGKIVATPGALEALEESNEQPLDFLSRHVVGDWGDVCEEDAKENDFSVGKTLRVFSVYHTSKVIKIWVISEADRSSTCILLPDEY